MSMAKLVIEMDPRSELNPSLKLRYSDGIYESEKYIIRIA